MNYADLGEKVKAKYSEYKDVDSAELGQKVAAKYPEYQALITEDKPPPQPQSTPNAGDLTGSVKDAFSLSSQTAPENQFTPFSQNPVVNGIINSASSKFQAMAMNSDAVKTGLNAYSDKQVIPSNTDPQGAFQKFTAPAYNAVAGLTSPRGALTAGMSAITDPRQLALMGAGSETVNNTAGQAFEDFTNNVKAPKLITDVAKGLDATNPKNIEAFHQKTMSALDDAFHNEGKKFDAFIQRTSKDSGAEVDLNNAVQDIIANKSEFTRLGSIVKRVPELNKLVEAVENRETANLKMTLADSQDLYKTIGSKISANKLAGNNLNYEDYNILKYLRNSLRQAQVESLPEDLTKDFADARKVYGQAADDYKLLRKQIKDPVKFEETIKSNLGGSNILKAKAKRLAPNVAGNIESAARAGKFKAGIKSVGKKAAAGAILTAGGKAAYAAYKHFNPS